MEETLVEKLRRLGAVWEKLGSRELSPVLLAAADEIESLEAAMEAEADASEVRDQEWIDLMGGTL